MLTQGNTLKMNMGSSSLNLNDPATLDINTVQLLAENAKLHSLTLIVDSTADCSGEGAAALTFTRGGGPL